MKQVTVRVRYLTVFVLSILNHVSRRVVAESAGIRTGDLIVGIIRPTSGLRFHWSMYSGRRCWIPIRWFCSRSCHSPSIFKPLDGCSKFFTLHTESPSTQSSEGSKVKNGRGWRTILELLCCYRDAAKRVKELFANVARHRFVEPTLAATCAARVEPTSTIGTERTKA